MTRSVRLNLPSTSLLRGQTRHCKMAGCKGDKKETDRHGTEAPDGVDDATLYKKDLRQDWCARERDMTPPPSPFDDSSFSASHNPAPRGGVVNGQARDGRQRGRKSGDEGGAGHLKKKNKKKRKGEEEPRGRSRRPRTPPSPAAPSPGLVSPPGTPPPRGLHPLTTLRPRGLVKGWESKYQ